MVNVDWLRALSRYNRWMNDKLYAIAESLDDEVRKRDVGAFFTSIHGTFNHLLVADRIWLGRFEGVHIPDGFIGPGGIRSLDQELYADFDDLRRERTKTDEQLSAWVDELSDARLSAPLVYRRGSVEHTSPLWWAVVHLFNHQTHHRGQITTLFTQLGHDPGVTDLFAMLRQESS